MSSFAGSVSSLGRGRQARKVPRGKLASVNGERQRRKKIGEIVAAVGGSLEKTAGGKRKVVTLKKHLREGKPIPKSILNAVYRQYKNYEVMQRKTMTRWGVLSRRTPPITPTKFGELVQGIPKPA